MRLVSATVALVLLAVLALPASAQVPPAPSAAPAVSVAFAEEEVRVSVDEAGLFKLTVRNEGAASGTPLDAQNVGEVVLAVSGAPEGWTVSLSEPAFDLAAQASKEIEVQVSVAPGAEAAEATITVTAVLTTPLEGLEPILGQVPGATQSATAEDSLTVLRDDSVTRDILESLGPWIYAILLLLVAAVLVAVGLSVASRRSLVRLSANARELTVAPGGRVAFPFRVEGLAKQEDSILLQASAVPEGWAAFLPVPELRLAAGDGQDLSLIVIAPRDAAAGSRQAILVSATSAKAPKGAANLEFVAVVEGGAVEAPKRRKA